MHARHCVHADGQGWRLNFCPIPPPFLRRGGLGGRFSRFSRSGAQTSPKSPKSPLGEACEVTEVNVCRPSSPKHRPYNNSYGDRQKHPKTDLQPLYFGCPVSNRKTRYRDTPKSRYLRPATCPCELGGGYRIRAILGAPGGQIIGFDQDVWVTALHYNNRNLRKSFAQYRALGEANLALLKALTPEQWKHYGVH